MQQHQDTFKVFRSFLNNLKPKRILEIGTGSGEFSFFLSQFAEFLSYDIVRHLLGPIKFGFIQKDCFLDLENIKKFLQIEGRSVLLCDGGDKIKEFNSMAGFLKPGDLILAHDYSVSNEKTNPEWQFVEITEKDIAEVCLKENLIPWNSKEFRRIGWVCKIKVPGTFLGEE